MYPVLFESGSIVIPAWHTFFVIGAIAAYVLFVYMQRQFYPEIDEGQLANIYAIGYLGGYFGARIFSIFNDQPDVVGFGAVVKELFTLGPMTFYGGFIGVTVCVYAYLKYVDISPRKVGDLAVPAGFLGLAYGRVGCFLNGDDYGKPVPEAAQDAWWSVTFPNLQDGVARYPTQIIETVAALLIVGALMKWFRPIVDRYGHGAVGIMGTVLYASYRFFAEYLRGDPRGWVIEDVMSTSQCVSLLVIAVCIVIFMRFFAEKQRVSS